jgi:hypothetical protein
MLQYETSPRYNMRHPHIHSNGFFYIIQAYQFNTLDTVFSPTLHMMSNTLVTLHSSPANTKAGDSTSSQLTLL